MGWAGLGYLLPWAVGSLPVLLNHISHPRRDQPHLSGASPLLRKGPAEELNELPSALVRLLRNCLVPLIRLSSSLQPWKARTELNGELPTLGQE